ncbi:helix-turn-helix domain-containing protein [Fulvivirga lutea]|uniref:Helix-turn-helix domain-containing protein n=1 Tax=Fulvivirga lutea TaxID=2810512 RepID=A0A975A255_9BACT|nr:AraC family transcriptional regulator [Fulvivirga lutea]QSE98187.1 helix-turn-helix domain-containing protein [Fulvivirga lutea]
MIFKEYTPHSSLKKYVANFWVVIGDGQDSFEQKVVPDGYPELIFHFGDNYEIKLFEKWELQDKWLFSGQISNHFYLRNQGVINMLGIKLQPWTPKLLFGLNMSDFTDRVVPASEVNSIQLNALKDVIQALSTSHFDHKKLEQFFMQLTTNFKEDGLFINSVQKIIDSRGQIKIEELIEQSAMSRRSLERKFIDVIGLPPKYFARIIRFNNIFKLMQEGDSSWCQVAVNSGYYDQAHFIKEFRKFTGEKPSSYGFDDNTLANFFLKRN